MDEVVAEAVPPVEPKSKPKKAKIGGLLKAEKATAEEAPAADSVPPAEASKKSKKNLFGSLFSSSKRKIEVRRGFSHSFVVT